MGWVQILSSSAGTDHGGSAGLVCHRHSFFATFGVPEEISSDDGPEFIAGNMEKFLLLWGIRHRLSSVGFPQSRRHFGLPVSHSMCTTVCCFTKIE